MNLSVHYHEKWGVRNHLFNLRDKCSQCLLLNFSFSWFSSNKCFVWLFLNETDINQNFILYNLDIAIVLVLNTFLLLIVLLNYTNSSLKKDINIYIYMYNWLWVYTIMWNILKTSQKQYMSCTFFWNWCMTLDLSMW